MDEEIRRNAIQQNLNGIHEQIKKAKLDHQRYILVWCRAWLNETLAELRKENYSIVRFSWGARLSWDCTNGVK